MRLFLPLMRQVLLLVVICLLGATSVLAQVLGPQSLSRSSYIIDKNGKLWTWGWNHDGQLGIGSTTDQNQPVQVPIPAGAGKWVLIAGGERHTLAVADSDRLYAWGYNGDGELGNGSTNSASNPVRITNPTGVTAWRWISAGARHSFALGNNGMLYAWGNNDHGQLGIGDRTGYQTPHLVPLPNGVTRWTTVAAGITNSLAIGSNGRLYLAGFDTVFKMGQTEVLNFTDVTRSDLSRIASPLPSLELSGTNYSVIFSDGSVGSSTFGFSSFQGESAAGVATGGAHQLILWSTGTISVAGDNTYGQSSLARLPAGVTQWVAVAAGFRHSLALANNGKLYAWGDNSVGELGDGTNVNQSVPVVAGTFGDSLIMSASFLAPSSYTGVPIPVRLGLNDNSSTQSLSEGTAFLTVSDPLRYASAPEQTIIPVYILPGTGAAVDWTLNADSILWPMPRIVSYFAYIRERGSAPLMISKTITIPNRTINNHVVIAYASDAVTKELVAGATVRFQPVDASTPEIRVTTSTAGEAQLGIYATGSYNITVVKEGYLTTSRRISIGSTTDSVILNLSLQPASLQGLFHPTVTLGPNVSKVFFADETYGYALVGTDVYRSSNGGTSWQNWSQLETAGRDLYFRTRSEGWVVGDGGYVARTTNGGSSWTRLASAGHTANLHAVTAVNSDVWVVGDSGVVLHYLNGTTPRLEARGLAIESLNGVSFVDSLHGMAVGNNSTVLTYESGKWTSLPTGLTLHYLSVVGTTPTDFWLGTSNGKVHHYQKDQVFPLNGFDLALAKMPINAVYFLNTKVGYAGGDSGTYVTFDRGKNWTGLGSIGVRDRDLNFFGLRGYVIAGDSLFNNTLHAAANTGVVYGRFIAPDNRTGITGVRVIAARADTTSDTTYTNELGNYVLNGLPVGNTRVTFTWESSSGTKTYDSTVVTGINSETKLDVFTNPVIAAVNDHSHSSQTSITLTPNPASEHVSIHLEGRSGGQSVTIYDALGRIVLSEQSFKPGSLLDVSHLAAGTYYVSVGDATTRLVITR